LWKPIPIPQTNVGRYFDGFYRGLPKARGYGTILVVLDRLTKYAHFVALLHPYNAKEVLEVFLNGIVKLHGFSESIISNRYRNWLERNKNLAFIPSSVRWTNKGGQLMPENIS